MLYMQEFYNEIISHCFWMHRGLDSFSNLLSIFKSLPKQPCLKPNVWRVWWLQGYENLMASRRCSRCKTAMRPLKVQLGGGRGVIHTEGLCATVWTGRQFVYVCVCVCVCVSLPNSAGSEHGSDYWCLLLLSRAVLTTHSVRYNHRTSHMK